MIYYEVRAPSDLEHFRKLIRYGKIMASLDCLVIDCFYDFGHFKTLLKPLPFLEQTAFEAKWLEVAQLLA
jgi:hypothetical protein